MPLSIAVAKNNILARVQPGDVVNLDSKCAWYALLHRIGYAGIRFDQKYIFGKQSRWRDTHSMLYFDPDKTFSVEPSVARWEKLEEYCQERVTLWRYTKKELTQNDIGEMEKAAARIIGTQYGYGQLVDFLINTLLHYPNIKFYHVFDHKSRRKVCSVGVRAVFEHLRHCINAPPGNKIVQPLFHQINPLASWPGGVFPQSKVANHYGVDVEATTPAHFTNSQYFGGEFELKGVFDQGYRVWPQP